MRAPIHATFRPLQFFQQILKIIRNEIDDLYIQRFFFSDRHAFAYRVFSPLHVAAALFGN